MTPIAIAKQEAAAAYAAGLRQLADMIEANPTIRRTPSPLGVWATDTRDDLIALTHAARAAGATVERKLSDQLVELNIRFGETTTRALAWRRDVCERVVVATREVVEMVPDPAAPAPSLVEQTRTIEVVEWRCADELAGDPA